ncbi:LptE family protein [Psychroserpens sp. Hel_I_66]|uniref:LptE family protein n=1 Tax=Psychroserpens sp. Hel_I_66 TaxID=1250004 RepID=UPI000647379F|nr:LptE family protein [Psychroserpens sp. Hel_I_66]
MKHTTYLILLCFTFLFGCGPYSFTGVQNLKAETFQVNYFQNTADLIEPGFDRDFKLALEDLILNQTNLTLTTTNGELIYEGEIVEYRISPTTAQANSTAAENRLSVTVNLRFFDTTDPEAEDFEKRFSHFVDYPGSQLLQGAQKDAVHEQIFERITQDIFNATLAKW